MADDLEEVDIEGSIGWTSAGAATAIREANLEPGQVRLLPYFDAYTVGCHPRERMFPGMAAVRALSGGQAGNVPVLLVDGIVRGVWHMRRAGRRLHVTVEPFDELSAPQRREVDDQVHRADRGRW